MRGNQVRPNETSSTGGGRSASTDGGALDLTEGPPLAPTPLANDSLWQQAARGDPIDLGRLAEREGAAGLLTGLEQGRSLALTALLALPYAEDGELALGRLCGLATSSAPSQIEPVLRAVQGIAQKMPRDRERLDVEGVRSCSAPLAALSVSERLSPHARDLASSARALLSELTQN